ncbi:uncharacterized protein LOC117336626 [Pecten maximus]|nr:uncharacterized protein LOC117336626 [Pecten maximus]
MRLRENKCIGEYDISTALWQKSCGVVDEITRAFHKMLTKVSSKSYPCLEFGDFVKQGSSREGLKIRHPDEFDMILPFTIAGVDIRSVPALDSNGERIPALVKLQIPDSQIEHVMSDSLYRSLRSKEVFERVGSDLFINAMYLQTCVISSIMDSTINHIQDEINAETINQPCSFTLTKASVFPPTYRFKIVIKSDDNFDELSYGRTVFGGIQTESRNISRDMRMTGFGPTNKMIEFDIVPGVLLQSDFVPNPDSWIPMTCERYAVMKWVHKGRYAGNYQDPNLFWRESSCGYEKHIMDVCQREQDSRYILTACRIMKAYIDGMASSSQLRSLLTSYHIKNIAIHCILFQMRVYGVKEALGYLIGLLEISIEVKFLPHYFYGNPNISKMFPTLFENASHKRLNLFRDIPTDHFVQAKYSFLSMQADLHGCFTERAYLGNQKHVDSFRELCTLYPANDGCILM